MQGNNSRPVMATEMVSFLSGCNQYAIKYDVIKKMLSSHYDEPLDSETVFKFTLKVGCRCGEKRIKSISIQGTQHWWFVPKLVAVYSEGQSRR